MWMNEYDIFYAVRRWDDDEHPVLLAAAQTLANLVDAVNQCSDGWPYWQAPSKAAAKLMALVDERPRDYDREDISVAEYRKALTPLKSFRTKRGVDFVIEEPLCGERFAGLRCARVLGHKGDHSIKAEASA